MKILLTKTVTVTWQRRNRKWYESKGYIYTGINHPLEVKVEDLRTTNQNDVEILCDYCLEEGKETIFTRTYLSYLESQSKLITKDACDDCGGKKRRDVFMTKYGVINPMQLEKIQEKAKQTNLEKYGVEYAQQNPEVREKIEKTNMERYGASNLFSSPLIRDKIKETNINKYGSEYYVQTDEFKEKSIETLMDRYGVDHYSKTEEFNEKRTTTMLERYGVENPMYLDEFKEKLANTNIEKYGVDCVLKSEEIRKKINQTLYINGTMTASRQQRYLQKLLGGKLNYPIDFIFLDIAFLDENIYLEFNGSGHELSVVLGDISPEEFKRKEVKRYYYLRKLGWRLIKVVSIKNRLPSDEIIMKFINFARNFLLSGHSWIEINIDDSKIISSTGEKKIKLGKLRYIRDEDLQ